jgi:CheY-like chemotaxis protein
MDGLEAVKMATDALNDTTTSDAIDGEIKSDDDIHIHSTGVSKRQYDAILMDFVMPVMKGPEATSAIRAHGYTGPIIGLTGNALQEDHDIFIKAGATQVLTKPFDMQALFTAINDVNISDSVFATSTY